MTTKEQRAAEGAERKVLIVDDEPHILSAIQDLLEDDFSVLAVTDAEMALRLLEEEEISVILSDQRMPGLSGDQFLREAQKRSRAIRVLITGYADLQALVRAVNEGKIYGYVAKPWEPEELHSLVSKAADYFTLVQDLERERALLHTLMDNIPDHIYFKDTASRYTRVNSAMASAMGLRDPRAAIGKTAADFLPESTRQLHEDERRIIELAQPLVDQVEEVREEGGKSCWYSITKVPLRDKQGAVAGLVGISRDITQRKQAEEGIAIELALQQVRNSILEMRSAADWQALVEVVLAQLQTLVRCNACSINLIDWQAGTSTVHYLDLKGTRLAMQPGLAAAFRQARETGGCVYRRTQAEMRQCGDVPELLALQVQAVLDVPFSGGTLAVNSTEEDAFSARDIQILERFAQVLSEAHRRLEDLKSLAQAEAQLRQAQKLEAIGRLAGGIAHDFNNLLTIIDGYSALQLRRTSPDQPQYESLQEIQKAADRGAGLVRQLLAFSRKQILAPKVLDLNTVVKDLEKMLHRLIGEDIELVVHLAPQLGQVKADPGQLEQVLMNLAINARDAMPRGGALLIDTRSVELDEDYASHHVPVEPGPYVLLEVSDTGVGMDAQTQARIFEPFFTTKAPGEGTGLGLSTVYGIVKQSGGYIWVYSEPGKGTSFKIYLPQIAATPEAAAPEERPQIPRGTETVLLVEDEKALRDLVGLILRQEGYTVLEAGNGQDALQLSAQHQGAVHLMVTDMVLPGMSGRELARQLVALRPDLKTVYMSGYSEEIISRQGALELGTAFLQKPFKFEALLLKLREVLDS